MTDARAPRLDRWLAGRVDGGSLAMFRIGFGLVMALTAWSYLAPQVGGTRLAHQLGGAYVFPYPGLEWLPRLAVERARIVVVALGIAALLLAAGVWVRAAAAVVWLAWTALFVQDAAAYNNHYYLQSLLAFGLIWSPANAAFSLLAAWQQGRGRPADSRVPRWLLVLLGGHVLVMYVMGGVAKLGHDWLILAAPLKSAIVGTPLAHPALVGWSPWALAWGGMLFDLGIGPALLWRRTRTLAVLLMLGFHGINHALLFDDIALFPLLGVVGSTLLLPPDWPRRLAARLGRTWAVVAPLEVQGTASRRARYMLALWFGVQLLVPLRHFAVRGNVDWTEEGGRFAWRMKAASRGHGRLRIEVEDPVGRAGAGGVYRSVDPASLDWSRLPALVIVHQPLAGERVVFNPHAGGGAGSDALARARDHWHRQFGRSAIVAPTRSLIEIMDAAATAGHDVGALRALALALRAPALAPASRRTTVWQLRAALRAAYGDPVLGRWLAPRLGRVHPFALSGAGAGARAVVAIEDSLVMARGADGLVRVDRTIIGWPRPLVVLLADDALEDRDWRDLPPRLAFETRDGRSTFLWNPHRELTPSQLRQLGANAGLCQTYARHVADAWATRHGHRPAVRMQVHVAFNGRPAQPLIDPTVDLASAPRRWLRHNPWILLRSD